MLVGASYFAVAYSCTALLDTEAPGRLNLIVILGIYNGFRFTIMGPMSLIRLLTARHRERRTRIERTAIATRTAPPDALVPQP